MGGGIHASLYHTNYTKTSLNLSQPQCSTHTYKMLSKYKIVQLKI